MTKCNENGVVAVQSKFGWLLSGAVPSQDNLETEITCNTIDTQRDYGEGLDTLLQRFWELDVIGIQEKDDQVDDVLSSFQHKNKFNQKTGRYIVRLPWKKVPHTIPPNFSLCKKRLSNLCKSLKKKSKETIKQ